MPVCRVYMQVFYPNDDDGEAKKKKEEKIRTENNTMNDNIDQRLTI